MANGSAAKTTSPKVVDAHLQAFLEEGGSKYSEEEVHEFRLRVIVDTLGTIYEASTLYGRDLGNQDVLHEIADKLRVPYMALWLELDRYADGPFVSPEDIAEFNEHPTAAWITRQRWGISEPKTEKAVA